jgi:hypothetical protein
MMDEHGTTQALADHAGMTVDDALAALGSDPAKAAAMARHHKVDRAYLGVTPPPRLTLSPKPGARRWIWTRGWHWHPHFGPAMCMKAGSPRQNC